MRAAGPECSAVERQRCFPPLRQRFHININDNRVLSILYSFISRFRFLFFSLFLRENCDESKKYQIFRLWGGSTAFDPLSFHSTQPFFHPPSVSRKATATNEDLSEFHNLRLRRVVRTFSQPPPFVSRSRLTLWLSTSSCWEKLVTLSYAN